MLKCFFLKTIIQVITNSIGRYERVFKSCLRTNIIITNKKEIDQLKSFHYILSYLLLI